MAGKPLFFMGRETSAITSTAGSKNERVCTCLHYHRPGLAGTRRNPSSQPLANEVNNNCAGNEDAKPRLTRKTSRRVGILLSALKSWSAISLRRGEPHLTAGYVSRGPAIAYSRIFATIPISVHVLDHLVHVLQTPLHSLVSRVQLQGATIITCCC